MRVSEPRVLVVGDGVIGLSVTVNLVTRGARVTLIGPGFHGAASPASAGLLAPSVERSDGPAQAFADASREAWSQLAELTRRNGANPFEIRRDGILRVARSEEEAAAIRATLRDKDAWLSDAEARARVPALAPVAGAALLAGDGVVNVPSALAALWDAVRSHPGATVEASSVTSLDARGGSVSVRLGDGRDIEGDAVVLCAGAWTPTIHGLPRPLPVRPLRGVMTAVDGEAVPFPVYDAAGHVYVFPRHGRTVIGATSDDVGFDSSAPEESATKLHLAAEALLPILGKRAHMAPWAGLRPMTPDGLPILGRDPDSPSVFYACGHGRNGFLEAALTGQVITALVFGEEAAHAIDCFSPVRFGMGN
jgi:glycine oxidase